MPKTAIRVDALSKRYRRGRNIDNFPTLKDAIVSGVRNIVRGSPRAIETDQQPDSSWFWALKDVSFEVGAGEALGVIGSNGAGKSTLLKILSRIVAPTAGAAEIHGRVGSLLEVGTGFHPELTGRENIYLNGAIMGLGRHQIRDKFDEIADFSGLQSFLDTPVKRYSSGMYLRLAFSVAAHIEPEILLVDEVLAVGDREFQMKCIGKVTDLAREGRTILFVSHNLPVVQQLCSRAVLIDSGGVTADGPSGEVISAYLRGLEQRSESKTGSARSGTVANASVFRDVQVTRGPEFPNSVLVVGEPAAFLFHVDGPLARTRCSFSIHDEYGNPITTFDTAFDAANDVRGATEGPAFKCEVTHLPLVPGRYRVDATLRRDNERQDYMLGAAFFDVEPGILMGRTVDGRVADEGPVRIPHRWTINHARDL